MDHFNVLRSVGFSPSVTMTPVLPGVIFRVDREKFAVLVC